MRDTDTDTYTDVPADGDGDGDGGARAAAGHASRGLLLLTGANAVYILTGWALTVVLARQLGPSTFGDYGVVSGLLTILQMLLTRGVPVGAGRAMAQDPRTTRPVMRTLWQIMMPLSVVMAATCAALAWPLAAGFDDDQLVLPLQVGSLAAVSFAINSTLLAPVNGLQLFGRQAAAMSVYGVVRLVTIIGGAAVWGLEGALAGYAIAPLIGALPLVGAPRPGADADGTAVVPGARDLVVGAVPLVLSSLGILLLLVVDLLAYKVVGTDEGVGIYAAAGTLAHVPYFLLQAAGLVLLPSIAAASAAERPQLVRRGMDDMLVMLAIPSVLLIAVGDDVLRTIFGSAFAPGTAVVAPLTIATAAVTVHATLVSIDAAVHRLRTAVALGLGGSVVLGVAVASLPQGSGPSRAAWVAAGVTVCIAVAHCLVEQHRLGRIFGLRAGVGIALACAVTLPVLVLPEGVATLLGAMLAGVVYAAIALRMRLLDLRRRPAEATGG